MLKNQLVQIAQRFYLIPKIQNSDVSIYCISFLMHPGKGNNYCVKRDESS